MLYLGIDQHESQITVNLRSQDGGVILKRQVSTRWEKMRAFFDDLAQRAALLGKGITTEHTENTEFTIGLPSGIVDGQDGLDKRLPVWPNM